VHATQVRAEGLARHTRIEGLRSGRRRKGAFMKRPSTPRPRTQTDFISQEQGLTMRNAGRVYAARELRPIAERHSAESAELLSPLGADGQ